MKLSILALRDTQAPKTRAPLIHSLSSVQTKPANTQWSPSPLLLILLRAPCAAEGNNLQNHPLYLSLIVKGVSPLQHKYSGAQARLSSADFMFTLHVKLSSFPAQLPFILKSLFS